MITRRIILLCAVSLALLSFGCGKSTQTQAQNGAAPGAASSSAAPGAFTIGIMTGTVSQGEEDFRAGQQMAARYPGRVKTVTFPDNFSSEVETVISQLTGLAADPEMKVVVAGQAIPGSVAAARKIREQRPDILIGFMYPHEDPDVAERVCDLACQPDELTRGTTLIESAAQMGVKHFVHYSFPRHMAMVLLARRRDIMIKECAKHGIEFHFVTAPDPTGEQGLPGTQQFIFEDVPRELKTYGPRTAFFSTNDGMQEPLIKAILNAREGYFIEQSTPAPTAGYPAALGLKIPPEKAGDMAWINAENKRLIAEHGMSGHFGTWPQSIDMVSTRAITTLLVDAAAKKADPRDSATVHRYFEAEAGGPVRIRRYDRTGNLWLVLMEHIVY
ncbi:MAG TPA: DUF3798 domain-containing protein [Candidatus Udaeobacter sp.]|jgi:hypothetical protein|nr:DUF3798 domain-containing protein [Candidatus Udaeobacter sp.]